DKDKALGKVSISYTNSIVGDEQRAYLRTLPSHIRLEYHLNNEKMNILLVHGSPRKVNEYLFEDREEDSMLGIMEQANADIMCFGHTHQPFHRILNSGAEGSDYFRHAINIGSVGKPKDKDPRGCYVILTINPDSTVTDKNTIQTEFVRFEYDVEKAAKAIENSPLPNEFADMLRNG